MNEKLTSDERRELTRGVPAYAERAKAVRIIDGHAADRATLVAQLEAERQGRAQALHEALVEAREVIRLEDRVAKLTRERDEALRAYDAEVIGRREEVTRCHGEIGKLRSEAARLTEALAAAERGRDSHYEAHVSAEQRALAAEARVREECARICEAMVVGGRAWTNDQAVAADALFAAAKRIRCA